MTENALITGTSSGLGLGLTEALLARNWKVHGISRRGAPLEHPGLRDARCDLARLGQIPQALDGLLVDVERLDLVVLNAGLLGRIQALADTPVEAIKDVMDVNVWANKIIFDWLISSDLRPRQIVLISSGAAVNGHEGWGAYSLSKATLNMLGMLYAHEMPDSHICALAPGLVDTAMQDYLCDPHQVDAARFASVARLREARGTDAMPGPAEAAERILAKLDFIRTRPSGCFLDLRNL